MAKRSAGIAGSAVLFGAAGLYLVYAGVTDVPLIEGLRALLRKQNPSSGETKTPWTPSTPAEAIGGGLAGIGSKFLPGDALGLVGNAKTALGQFRQLFPNMTMHGRGLRPDTPSSDHPLGKAIDLMTKNENEAQLIISLFKRQTGAKYWIWNRKKGSRDSLWTIKPYTGVNPHTDHVHLSYF